MPTVAMGAFDGIHIGHAGVVRTALAWDRDASVVCFEPIPRQFFDLGTWRRRLTTAGERRKALESLGVRNIVTVPFDDRTVSMSPVEFLESLLLRMDFGRVVVGWDFHFGAGRSGSCAELERWCTSKGVDSIIAAPLETGGDPVKSERIRGLLDQGDLEGCRGLLGRFYSASGACARGRGVGRKLGFPTLNIRVPACKMLPPPGSYAGLVEIEETGGNIPAAVFVPGQAAGPVEAHLLNPVGEAYGRSAEVRFVSRLRDSVESPGIGELRELIAGDVKATVKVITEMVENRKECS
jgi:riboflavin kinase / FMN adenylyltransferase